MIYYFLVILASFHGEIKYKTIMVDSKEVCERVKIEAIKKTAADNPDSFAVECVPVTLAQHT